MAAAANRRALRRANICYARPYGRRRGAAGACGVSRMALRDGARMRSGSITAIALYHFLFTRCRIRNQVTGEGMAETAAILRNERILPYVFAAHRTLIYPAARRGGAGCGVSAADAAAWYRQQ